MYAAADGTVETAYRWNGRRTQGDTNSYGNMLKLRPVSYTHLDVYKRQQDAQAQYIKTNNPVQKQKHKLKF